MMLAAHSFGLGSVWLNVLMTLRDKEPVKSVLDEFGIPSNHVVWASVALGWPVADGVRIQRKPDVIHFLRDML
jgi:long-chain acyl-CoA synthetase